MEITLSFITVNYNGLDDTCALIDSIPFNDEMEVIVVDNASLHDEAKVIAERYPSVRVIRSERNLGFAGGNNLGIKAAQGRYIYLINNDTELTSDSHIEHLLSRLSSSRSVGMVCPKIRFAWGNHLIQFAGYTPLSPITLRNHAIGCGESDNGQYDTPHPTPYAHGAAMMVKREAVVAAGLMPECYFLYYEELDWSMMIRRAGYDIWYEPASTIYHKESRSTGQDSPLKTYYLTRNRLLFAHRNMGGLRRHLAYIWLVCIAGVKNMVKHTLGGHPALAKATWRGIIDFTKLQEI